ncbi:four helix bundle protein [Carboxylicivirga sp. M1479]|uniref:four helix bundle protein n=1 Tax=Carboxylicivirga sp. M1479 TaxID=2594476 RepID=UPI0011786AB7|nr:four helix bundle protein [Carboxylicivirga sp. M1479]TRX70557.1 four helix bundle protein [Carboxylicivirga sp. M1479]
MGNFKELKVWQEAKDLSVSVYRLTSDGKLAADYGLKDQMQRSAVSVPSNIAEGDELDTNKQAVRHFYIAKGSCAELETQLIIAYEIDYIGKEVLDTLSDKCQKISAMLRKLINARSS